MGIEVLLGLGLLGMSAMSMMNQKDSDSAVEKVPEDIGNLTDEEAATSASRGAMRAESYFTSPTGVLGDAPKRGARLTGA